MGVWNPGPGATAGDDTFTGDATNETADGLAGDDVLSGGAGDDALLGNIGDDTLDGGAGDDLIVGDSGRDAASYASAPGAVVVDLRLQGGPQLINNAGFDTLVGIESLIGSPFDDLLFGDDGDNVLSGGNGQDQMTGRAGHDVLRGGGGDDLFSVLIDVDANVDQIYGGSEIGDAGFDMLFYSFANAGVIVQLSGYATTRDGVLIALLSGIEAVTGTRFDDALIGDGADNFFEGGDGADWIVGGAGDDLFNQQWGDPSLPPDVDRLFGDAGFDTLDFSTTSGPGLVGVIVHLSGYATGQNGELLALFSGMEGVIGTFLDDALIGDGADNYFRGELGSDWIVGGAGDDVFDQVSELSGPQGVDRLFGDAGIDAIDYGAAGVGVIVQLAGYATTNSGGAVTLTTFTGMENAVGSNFADALIGNGADNRITGGAGADWLVGQGGNDAFVQTNDTTSVDRLFGDAGEDTIDYSGATAGIVVQLSGYATTSGGGSITLATFTGIENAVGSSLADALIGAAGANVIAGGDGADWLVGGAGADTFVYQALESTRDSIRDFTADDLVDLAAIDANPTTGADDAFAFATVRHAGVVGEAVVANFGGSSLVSLHLDGDDIADMTIQIVHQSGFVVNAGDFVL